MIIAQLCVTRYHGWRSTKHLSMASALVAMALLASACLKPNKCEVDYTVSDSWSGGFVADVAIKNLLGLRTIVMSRVKVI